jgi:anaerobic magnesium-protoporphyrin IX monomethyl ester cyclase
MLAVLNRIINLLWSDMYVKENVVYNTANFGDGRNSKKMRVQNSTIPYGVLSIATYINAYSKTNAKIKILDLNVVPYNGYSKEQLLQSTAEEIKRFAPDIIGISAMYNHMYGYVTMLSGIIKDVNRNIVVVAGGCCIMAYYDKLLSECEALDAICYSEGEIPILDLLEACDVRETLERHPAWLTRKGLKNGKQPRAVFVDNLDDIPPIDFDLININLYGTHRSSFRPEKKEREICLPITTTRGCPYNCVFCIAGALHGKKVRKMSAKRVVSDVQGLISKYGINVLSIEDDQFLIDRERSKQILEGLSELNISLIADSGFTVTLLDDEIARLLKRAGLQTATLAIESGSNYILHEIIDKPLKLENVPPVVESIRNSGLYCHSFLVVGFPGEKEHHRQETIDFIKRVGIDWCYITCATPVKGSRLYDICIENGYINKENFTENAYYASCINTPDFTAEYITKRAYLMNLELNFVNNYRLRIGDYKTASMYMDHVLSKYPGHAFAHYYMSKAYEGLKEDCIKVQYHKQRFDEIIEESDEWKEYAQYFQLI